MENMKKELEQPIRRKREIQPLQGVHFIGFDLDGTLLQQPVKSHPEIFGSKAAQFFGTWQEVATQFAQSTMGMPTEQQLLELPNALNLPAMDITRLISSDLRKLIADTMDGEFFNQQVQLFSEVPDVLKKLKEQGIKLFISSSRPTTNIHKVLSDHPELSEWIDFAIGTDPQDATQKKGEGHMRKAAKHFGIPFEQFVTRSLFIGDTPSDMQSAQAIGVKAIGRSGTIQPDHLFKAGAISVVADLLSLPEHLAKN